MTQPDQLTTNQTESSPKLLIKSLNRSADVLHTAPLRSNEWLKTFETANDEERRVLGETWLARFYQHVTGLSQTDYTQFLQKLLPRQIEFLQAITSYVDSSFFATQDIPAHEDGVYDMLWTKKPSSELMAWIRNMWLGSEDEQLAALPDWFKYLDPVVCGRYGNLLPLLAERAAGYANARHDHGVCAAYISCWTGEQGPRRDKGLPDKFSAWQDLGYFCSKAIFHQGISPPTVADALAVKNAVTSEYPEVFLGMFSGYLYNAMAPSVHEGEQVRRDTLLGKLWDQLFPPTSYDIAKLWLSTHAKFLECCRAMDTSVDEAIKQLREKLEKSQDIAVVTLPHSFENSGPGAL